MRVLVPRGSGEAGKRVRLDEAEVHHLRVRRAKDREKVEILDGAGLVGTGCLAEAGRDWAVDVEQVERTERPPETRLAVAAGDRDRFSWLVEKSVELAVTRIVPLETSRTAGVASRLKAVHLPRLRRLALEAIKQCGVTWAPVIDDPAQLGEFLRAPSTGNRWLADEAGEPAPAGMDQTPVTVVIGPEGGFSPDERASLLAAGFRSIMLGPHTLRFETAALAAAAAVAQARLRGTHG
jgi:16S rRNA (uracil1498-N3)-methyltransferase